MGASPSQPGSASASWFAATLRDIEPFVRECAAHAVENLLGDEIAYGAFHHAPGRGRGNVYELFRGEKLLKLGLDFRVQIFEPLPAMADHRRTKRAKGFLAYFDRSRNMVFYVCHKPAIFPERGSKGKTRIDMNAGT